MLESPLLARIHILVPHQAFQDAEKEANLLSGRTLQVEPIS